MPIFQERYPDGINYCFSSMEYLCIFTSLVGRYLNRKLAHKLFATDGPDTALSLEWQTWLYHVASQHLNCRHDCTTWPHSTCIADMTVPRGLTALVLQTWLYHVASQHLSYRDGPTSCLSNWLADTAPPLGLIPLYWQIWPFNLALYNDTGRYGTTTWPYTTILEDMALQLGLMQRYWQIWPYNLASYHLIGRYVTTTWPVPSSLYVLPCCLRSTVDNHFSEPCGKVRAAAAATVANVSTYLECEHDIYRANYCCFSEYL